MKNLGSFLLMVFVVFVTFFVFSNTTNLVIEGLSKYTSRMKTEFQVVAVSETADLRAEVDILKQQLRLISMSAILRRTASGTESVTFPAHFGSDEFIDIRKASSTAEILADEFGIKADERRKKEREQEESKKKEKEENKNK